MKIKSLKVNNFVKFTDFEIKYDGKVTHLVGVNGSGKTTLGLTAIWACLKGIAEKSCNGQLIGERYRFIGDSQKTADLELVLLDEKNNVELKIQNKISKDGNKITFDAPVGYKLPDGWLNNLLSIAFMSTKHFISYSSKEQALLLGIDTSEFDKKIEKLKEDYTYSNRKIRDCGEIKFVEKVEYVEISELIEDREKIDDFNRIQRENTETICSLKEKLEDLKAQKKYIEEQIEKAQEVLLTMPEIQLLKSTDEINEKIKNSEEINRKAVEYQNYLDKKSQYDAAKAEIDTIKNKAEKVKQEKIDYIKEFDFGFKELSVNDNGELLLADKTGHARPIKEPYFSKGELELIVAKLHAKVTPDEGLRLRFIDDFELLDEKNQEKIINDLLNSGFQVITAQVSNVNDTNKDNVVVLSECKKV